MSFAGWCGVHLLFTIRQHRTSTGFDSVKNELAVHVVQKQALAGAAINRLFLDDGTRLKIGEHKKLALPKQKLEASDESPRYRTGCT